MIEVGAFRLVAPAGRGAMAEVWRAEHPAASAPVAVKVVTAPIGRKASFRARFAHELRAVTRLDHPGVVRTYDHGEISPEIAEASGGRLPSGAPYLAMEWADGGTLSSLPTPLPWPALRALLLSVLDALGHAHARGVVHRDVKPDNILIAERGPVLTDFGVAYTPELAAKGSQGLVGSPSYMSPEQITGETKSLGPWSDLYAVGCLATTLVRGRPPFDAPDPLRVARMHLLRPPPLLDDGLPVPEGFERWLHRLLAKRPSDRFQFAADAAVALLALPDEAPEPVPHATTGGDEATLVAGSVLASIPTEHWMHGPLGGDRPPVPPGWQRPTTHTPPSTPIGLGRTLFALRGQALHGRHAERDRLWAAMRAVATGGGARAVLVSGAPGLGKSRVSTWLARRAHELGVADVLEARHDATGGADTGLAPMLARYARCAGLASDARQWQLHAVLGPDADALLVEQLAALTAPDGRWADSQDGMMLTSTAERDEALAGALALLARRRPLVLLLEDVHWSEDTLGFVEHLLVVHPALPVLVVGTLDVAQDDDALAEEAAALLDRLTGLPTVEQIVLGPLAPAVLAEQLRARLPLTPALTRRVVERAAGNPLFAEVLVEHWIDADALEDDRSGFRLRAELADALPDGLRGLWRTRLVDALGPDEHTRHTLELAAVLGQNVDDHEWRAALRHAGLALVDANALGPVFDAGLIVGEPHVRWAFDHGLLRETLLEDARRAGRLARWHQACADALAECEAPADRRGRHLLGAGDLRGALEPLFEAADEALDRKQGARARRALIGCLHALRGLRRPRLDRDWVRLRNDWARLCYLQIRSESAIRHARHAARDAEAIGDRALLATALVQTSHVLAVEGATRESLDLTERAVEHAAAAGEPVLLASALREVGRVRLALGDVDGAREALDRALDALGPGEGDDPLLRAYLLTARANVARIEEDLDRATALAAEARDAHARAGSRTGRASMCSLLGSIARAAGDDDAAEAHFREAMRLFGGSKLFAAMLAEYNYAQLRCDQGHRAEGRARFESIIERLGPGRGAELLQIVYGGLLPIVAEEHDWPGWDRAMEGLGPARRGEINYTAIIRGVEIAAEHATEAGEHARAADAWALIATQLEHLGRDPAEARAASEACRARARG